jgi:hypothetical protein
MFITNICLVILQFRDKTLAYIFMSNDLRFSASFIKLIQFINEAQYNKHSIDKCSRFITVDPLAEKYYSWSPYSYVRNNPRSV